MTIVLKAISLDDRVFLENASGTINVPTDDVRILNAVKASNKPVFVRGTYCKLINQ